MAIGFSKDFMVFFVLFLLFVFIKTLTTVYVYTPLLSFHFQGKPRIVQHIEETSQKGQDEPIMCCKTSFQDANLALAKCSDTTAGLRLYGISVHGLQTIGMKQANDVKQNHTIHLFHMDILIMLEVDHSLQMDFSEHPGTSPSSSL